MSDTLPERPTFTSGQYIGASDLNAAVDYARDETRRVALSARTWGIGTGLALVEVPDASGGVQMFIEPGLGWDGYGRPVAVLAPAPVTPALFTALPSGNQIVWLRYNATGTQAISPGFQTCNAGDPTTRVLESYAIEVGNRPVAQRSDGVVIAGATVADPREMLIAVDQNASVVLDGSAPHQSFPDDTGRWLIPVGIAAYVAGSPGSFMARSPAQLVQSRSIRRYMGASAESLLAADGVLRLRDRQSDKPAGATDDQLDQTAAIQPADLAADPNNSNRLIGNELVWIEGNLRVTGNARLFGTQLELRDSSGGEDNAPEFLRRGVSANNTLGGQDLQICIGSTVTGTAGADRLTIGVLTTAVSNPATTSPDGALNELMVVRTDGRVAIGTNAIDNYSTLANTMVVATPADTGITVVSGSSSTGNLFFADGTGKSAQMDGFVAYDHAKQQLALGAGAVKMLVVTPGQTVIGSVDPASFVGDTDQLVVASSDGGAGITIAGKQDTIDSIDFGNGTLTTDSGFIRYFLQPNRLTIGTNSSSRMSIDGNGLVGIGTQAPSNFDPDANQLVVASGAGAAGITIAAASGTAGRLDFADGVGTPHAGFIRYDQQNKRMEFGTASQPQVFLDQNGRVGIGTNTPGAPLEIQQGSTLLSLTASWIQAQDSGQPSALLLQPNGGGFAGVGLVPGVTPMATLHVRVNGLASPGLRVDAIGNAPTALLQVRGTLPGPAKPTFPTPAQHVARFENTATGPANVLALSVGTPEGSDTNCNFVTFYDGNGDDIGAIVGAGTPSIIFPQTISYQSMGADYAEAVRRAPDVSPIGPGKVVGVHAGLVSMVTDGADALFVTSGAPAVLGKMPDRNNRDGYEILAFLGQVPVTVTGPVRSGDLIVASGHADGTGRAVSPQSVQPEELALIVGRAWENLEAGRTQPVNAIVGPGVATAAAAGALLGRQAHEIKRLAGLLARRKSSGAA